MTENGSRKNFVMPVIIAVVLLVIVGGGFYFFTEWQSSVRDTETIMEDDENMILEGENQEIMGSESIANYKGSLLAGNSAPLLDFVKADYDTALKSDKLIILYFYANWCPICRKEFPKMQDVFDKLTANNVIGFRVNYNDNQTDSDEKNLAREFGIAYQHTKILIKNGVRILKSPESWDEDRYFSEINKYLK